MLVLTRCISNTAFKPDAYGFKATRFHSLTEGFGNAPSVVRNQNRSVELQRSGHTWTGFYLDLPSPRTTLNWFFGLGRSNLARSWARSRRACWGACGGFNHLGRCTALHLDDVRGEVVEGRVVGQDEVLVNWQRKPVSNFSHDLGLLHGVNAQFTFQILVHFNEIGRITCVADHDFDQDRFNIGPRTSNRWCRGRLWLFNG